jgi:hypothetical protein
MAKDNIQKILEKGAYKEIEAKARKGLKDESGMPYATIYKLLTGKNVPSVKKKKGGSMKKYEEGGKVSKPMSKKEAFAKHKKTTGSYHKLDPLHPMNAERTGAPKKMPRAVGLVRKKSGGKVGKCSHNRMY